MKDNFSTQSDAYAKYRPTYPEEFFAYLNSIVLNKQRAWDCGTGNGQVAFELAKTFEEVYATDISQTQIDNALRTGNIVYSVQPAEKTNFADHFFDLVITAQAIHWFDFERFYNEVRRTAKNGALLCVVGYGRIRISEEIDSVIIAFYRDIIGKYWDTERKYIDENYQTIPFPFKEIKTPHFVNIHNWTLEHLIGYINTWSAVKHFIRENKYNPVDELESEIGKIWGEVQIRKVQFPILLRIGEVGI